MLFIINWTDSLNRDNFCFFLQVIGFPEVLKGTDSPRTISPSTGPKSKCSGNSTQTKENPPGDVSLRVARCWQVYLHTKTK